MKLAPVVIFSFVACGGAAASIEAPLVATSDAGAAATGSATAPASAIVTAPPPASVSAPPPERETFVAVASPDPSESESTSASAPTRVASKKSPPKKVACPATFGGGPAPACASGENPGPCTYPQGTCACGTPIHCGGAAPAPTPPQWICTAPRKRCPAEGSPCKAKETCHDGECPWNGVHECQQGKWRTVMVPPPP